VNDDGDVLPLQMMRWAFVPFWETTVTPKFQPINAQAENVMTGMFKQSVQKRRCLIPADGFYEWLRLDEKPSFRSTFTSKASGPS